MKSQLAPHIGLNSLEDGMFIHLAGKDVLSQIDFAAEQGFGGIEDNFFTLRSREEQVAIGKLLHKHGLEMGASVFNITDFDTPTLVLPNHEVRERLLAAIDIAVAASKINGAKVMATLSGPRFPALPEEIQNINMIDNLRWLGDQMAPHGIILGVEAITARGWPNIFLNSPRKALQIVKAVNHPNVKLIYDIFHVQVEDGDVLRGIDEAWDEIALIQLADAPSRTEPGSGELNIVNILQKIKDKGFKGLIEMEHAHSMPGAEGEKHSLAQWQSLLDQLR